MYYIWNTYKINLQIWLFSVTMSMFTVVVLFMLAPIWEPSEWISCYNQWKHKSIIYPQSELLKKQELALYLQVCYYRLYSSATWLMFFHMWTLMQKYGLMLTTDWSWGAFQHFITSELKSTWVVLKERW